MKRLVLLAAALAVLFPVYPYLRGIGGSLSVTSLFLLAAGVVAPKALDRREVRILSSFVLAGALILYPMALGLTRVDPYALGYPDRVRSLLLGLAPALLLAWLRGSLLVPLASALALAGFRLEVLESTNLWDYLFDPWLVLCLAGFSIFCRPSKSP